MKNFFKKRRGATYGTTPVAPHVASHVAPGMSDERQAARVRAAEASGPRLVSLAEAGHVRMARPRPAVPERIVPPQSTNGTLPELVLSEAQEADAELPRFSLPVTSLRVPGHMLGVAPEVNALLREAFTPTRPKLQVNSLFVGRLNTLRRIIAAIEEERAHVVLYGDRGRGKTSLANAIQQIAGQAGYFTLKLTCSAELGFEDIFRNLLRRVPGSFYQAQLDSPFAARRPPAHFEELLPRGSFSVTEVNDVLCEIQGGHLLLILDEFDRVVSGDLRNKLAELIKNLTDSSAPVTLFIVGVAEDVHHLLGRHPSIQRSLAAIHLPLMSDREIERILSAGVEMAGMGFEGDVRARIVALAGGLPYYAQLLGLHAARSAAGRGSRMIERADVGFAVARCLNEADQSLAEAYGAAVGPDARPLNADVLYAAARCRTDEFGTFQPADLLAVPVGRSGGLTQSAMQPALAQLSEQGEAGILVRIAEPGGFSYRFGNQMMRHYILLRQAQERGLV